MKKLYSKIIKSISKGLNESGLFDDDLLNTDELTLDELNIANELDINYIDLGLPSGTLWAECNVGANKPEDYGVYLNWYDAKSSYNLPTLTLWEELYNKCNWKWSNINGTYGAIVTGPNRNTIFLPACGGKDKYRNKILWSRVGAYYSSTLYPKNKKIIRAYYTWFLPGSGFSRNDGLSIDTKVHHQSCSHRFSIRLVKL